MSETVPCASSKPSLTALFFYLWQFTGFLGKTVVSTAAKPRLKRLFPENACFQKQNRIKADSPCTLFPFIPGYSVYHSPAAKALNCKFNTLPCHAQTPAHSASCRGSGGMRLFGDSPGKARPGLCAFFLQRMRFGKCDNLLNRRGVRAVLEIRDSVPETA